MNTFDLNSHPKKICFVTILFFSAIYLQAQSGKLVGSVTDATTGEPLIGANILINGTTLGAATDTKGKFLILKIPPATYSVTASILGYAKETQTEVDINVDRTTEINFKLKDESIQLEQVIVVAPKPKIIRDQTSTSSTINDAQIKAAPIEGLRGAMDLSAGFQKSETGNYSVRGSGAYEVNFQINGVTQTNSNTNAPAGFTEKANNSWKYDVNPIGVQQLQLISGGFSAEYGNAQGGIVKVVMKEGAPKFTGEVRVEYRPPGQYHWGEYLYSQNNYEWQKWGNVNYWWDKVRVINPVTNKVTWNEGFLQALNIKNPNRYEWLYNRINTANPDSNDVKLWNEIVNHELNWAYNLWVRNHTPGDDNPLGVYDYRQFGYTRYMFGFGGPLGKDPNLLKFYFSGEYKKNPTRLPTPEQNQIYQNYVLNTTYIPEPAHKFKTMISFQKYRGGIWSGSDDIRWAGIAFTPGSRSTKYYVNIDPVRVEQTFAQSLNWTYTINQNSFLEAAINHQNEKYELPYVYLPGYDQQRDVLDSLYDYQGSVLRPGEWWETVYYKPPEALSTVYYQDTRTDHYSFNIDYVNQILQTNLIKAGFKYLYWDMFNNGVIYNLKANALLSGTGVGEYYRAYPYNVSFYVQDKMEYSGMIANIGLRAESYNFQTPYPEDMFNYFYLGKDGPNVGDSTIGNPNTLPSETKFILLPRLGISFPIGENTAFRIQYGHFASMPIFSQALLHRPWKGWEGLGDPNLDPKRTVQYEFGLQQVIDQEHRLDVALYYNDRVSQINLIRYASLTGTNLKNYIGATADNKKLYSYTSFANNAFGGTFGIEIVFEKINYQNWSYRLSYNLSQTNEGIYGPQTLYPENRGSFLQRNTTGEFLASTDRTHNFRGLVQYRVRENEGMTLFGINLFENSVFGLTYSVQSGTPFTYVSDFNEVKDVVNNRRYPLESSFDFNFIKNIDISSYKIIVGVRIMNVFDNKWLTPLSNTEDLINWIEYGYTIEDKGNDPPDKPRLNYIASPFKAFRNIPRQIFFTVGFGF